MGGMVITGPEATLPNHIPASMLEFGPKYNFFWEQKFWTQNLIKRLMVYIYFWADFEASA